jgi:diacylglycerol kinase family enzyme
VRDPDRLPEAVRKVISKGCKQVIVGGGDGTISSVVDDFAYRDVVFGLLPLGTANSFARTLGIPLTVAKAVDVIVRATSLASISAWSMTIITPTWRLWVYHLR